jgi:hypothetical protein
MSGVQSKEHRQRIAESQAARWAGIRADRSRLADMEARLRAIRLWVAALPDCCPTCGTAIRPGLLSLAGTGDGEAIGHAVAER